MKKFKSIYFVFLITPSLSVYGSSCLNGDHDEWLIRAEQGDAEAQYLLGSMYHDGDGVPQDYKEAVRWYTKSAEQWHEMAQYNLGVMYYKGNGVPRDYEEALRLVSEAGESCGKCSIQVGFGIVICRKCSPELYRWRHTKFMLLVSKIQQQLK